MKKVLSLAVVLTSVLGSANLAAVETEPGSKESIENGAAHYRIFCINCHGPELDGNGPLVELLKIAPTDLRNLNATATGDLTVKERVFNAVDGRHKVGTDEGNKMPIFSDNLEMHTVLEIADFIDAVQFGQDEVEEPEAEMAPEAEPAPETTDS